MLIFAILTGIAFYGISVYTAQANETRVSSDLGTFEVAIKDYMLNNMAACSDGKLTPEGLNHYLTQENLLTSDTADDDIGSEVSVSAGVGGEVGYKKLSTLEDPWGHQYRVVIRNNADRQNSDGEYCAKGTDRAFIYIYSMGKDGKGAADDTKQDDSVLVVQYSDGEVFSKAYLPSDSKNQSVSAPAYTAWNKDDSGKHSVMNEAIFAVGAVDPSTTPGGGGSSGGGGTGGGSLTPGGDTQGETLVIYEEGDYIYYRENPNKEIAILGANLEDRRQYFADNQYSKWSFAQRYMGTLDEYIQTYIDAGDTEDQAWKDLENTYVTTSPPDNPCFWNGLSEETFTAPSDNDVWKVMVKDGCKNKTSYTTAKGNIAGLPVTDMSETYKNCKNMIAAPEIPHGVTNMSGTFYGCSNLTTAPEIPYGVTNMGNGSGWAAAIGTFSNCTSLVSAPRIPDTVTKMAGTFYNCTALAAAPSIPNSVTYMPFTFYGCASITTAPEIPESVTDIMLDTFRDCKALKGQIIKIPSSAAYPGETNGNWTNGPSWITQ